MSKWETGIEYQIIQNLPLLGKNILWYIHIQISAKFVFHFHQGLEWICGFDVRLVLRFAATNYYVNSCETGIVHQKARMITLFLNFCSSLPLKRDIIKARTLKNTQALMKRKKFETF